MARPRATDGASRGPGLGPERVRRAAGATGAFRRRHRSRVIRGALHGSGEDRQGRAGDFVTPGPRRRRHRPRAQTPPGKVASPPRPRSSGRRPRRRVLGESPGRSGRGGAVACAVGTEPARAEVPADSPSGRYWSGPCGRCRVGPCTVFCVAAGTRRNGRTSTPGWCDEAPASPPGRAERLSGPSTAGTGLATVRQLRHGRAARPCRSRVTWAVDGYPTRGPDGGRPGPGPHQVTPSAFRSGASFSRGRAAPPGDHDVATWRRR